jgi:hypothetical protein
MTTRCLLSIFAFFLVCATGWTVFAQGKAAVPVKHRWEYKSIEWNVRGSILTEDFRRSSFGSDLFSRMQELGEQGWELVTATEAAKDPSATPVTRFYFKRLK